MKPGRLLARRYVVVGELPAEMATPGRGAGYLPVMQFIKDWNNQPESRIHMLAGGLPAGIDTETAAKIAAVVHALCERDAHPLPDWIASAVASEDVALVSAVDLTTPYGQDVRASAPEACRYHRVYFSARDLYSTRWSLPRTPDMGAFSQRRT